MGQKDHTIHSIIQLNVNVYEYVCTVRRYFLFSLSAVCMCVSDFDSAFNTMPFTFFSVKATIGCFRHWGSMRTNENVYVCFCLIEREREKGRRQEWAASIKGKKEKT